MAGRLTTSNASRDRRWIAVTFWLGLLITAMVLWNGRTRHEVVGSISEEVALLLAVFIAFVSLFAWMLYNPALGVSAETPTLMLAGAATLFLPCVIGYCMMPVDSPLRFWLAGGLFVLLAIAVMSPVPEEFFGIPRERHSYLDPIPFLDISHQSVINLKPDWLKSADLSGTVTGVSGRSLAPNAWRQDRPPSRYERRTRKERDVDADALQSVSDAPARDSVFGPSSQKYPDWTGTSPAEEFPAATVGHALTEIRLAEFRDEDWLQVAERSRQSEFERIQDNFGGELIEGTMKICFDQGQKRANLHIPFTPPLPGIPEVECESVDEESLRIRVPELQPWGIRIEARRADASAPLDAEVGFAAVYVPPGRRQPFGSSCVSDSSRSVGE